MKNRSIWSDTKIEKDYPKLDKDINIDILIIGGGITGINTLYNLKDKDIILVERNKIGQGITLNTTGKITFLQDKIYNKIMKCYNEKVATMYLNSQLEAIEIIKKNIEENNIDCDFKETKSHVFTNNKNEIKDLKKLKKFLNKNNIEVIENEMPLFQNKYSLTVLKTYLFNPIKYINGLLNKIDSNKIYENTSIKDITKKDGKYVCKTNSNTIMANKVILATHYPYFITPYFFPLKGYLEKSYLIAFKDKIDEISLISYNKPTISLRTYLDNVIFLSDSHNICNKVSAKIHFSNLLKFNEADYMWSNTDIITNDYMPYVGYIKDNFLIATGYNTWGMTNSAISAKIISDLILDNKNPYIKLFNPKRHKNYLRLISDSFSTIKGYYEGFVNKGSKVKYKKINGVKVMIVNEGGREYIVKRKCPHAKCDLIYNEVEKTFDCPCHASRFDLEGNCIKGPSKDNIKFN